MEFKKTGIDKEMFKSQIASGITYHISFKELRQLLFIFFGGLILTLFTYNYFHHDRFESIESRASLDKMTGKVYISDRFVIENIK